MYILWALLLFYFSVNELLKQSYISGFIFIFLGIVLLMYRYVLQKEIRKRQYKKDFSVFKQLVYNEKYHEALKKLRNSPVLRKQYKLTPDQRKQIIELEILTLENLGKIEKAVVSFSFFLSSTYKPENLPEEFVVRWIYLYVSCKPIRIERFYFCPTCGLDPDMIAFLYHMIKRGCPPPSGYPGKSKSGYVVQFGETAGGN